MRQDGPFSPALLRLVCVEVHRDLFWRKPGLGSLWPPTGPGETWEEPTAAGLCWVPVLVGHGEICCRLTSVTPVPALPCVRLPGGLAPFPGLHPGRLLIWSRVTAASPSRHCFSSSMKVLGGQSPPAPMRGRPGRKCDQAHALQGPGLWPVARPETAYGRNDFPGGWKDGVPLS